MGNGVRRNFWWSWGWESSNLGRRSMKWLVEWGDDFENLHLEWLDIRKRNLMMLERQSQWWLRNCTCSIAQLCEMEADCMVNTWNILPYIHSQHENVQTLTLTTNWLVRTCPACPWALRIGLRYELQEYTEAFALPFMYKGKQNPRQSLVSCSIENFLPPFIFRIYHFIRGRTNT